MPSERFEAEFGYYAEWLVDAIDELGLDDPVPAACRGTGNPELLEHLAAALSVRAGSWVLDVGVGLGGPAAWLARTHGCELVGVDLMTQAAFGFHRLFSQLEIAVASTKALPFRDETFDGVWALGVIEMLADKKKAFGEMLRMLVPGGRVVLYDFVGAVSEADDPPLADRFEPADASTSLLSDVGFRVLVTGPVPKLAPPPPEWQSVAASARERVRSGHGSDVRFAVAEAERASFNRLRASGLIEEWEFVAEKPA